MTAIVGAARDSARALRVLKRAEQRLPVERADGALNTRASERAAIGAPEVRQIVLATSRRTIVRDTCERSRARGSLDSLVSHQQWNDRRFGNSRRMNGSCIRGRARGGALPAASGEWATRLAPPRQLPRRAARGRAATRTRRPDRARRRRTRRNAKARQESRRRTDRRPRPLCRHTRRPAPTLREYRRWRARDAQTRDSARYDVAVDRVMVAGHVGRHRCWGSGMLRAGDRLGTDRIDGHGGHPHPG
jgi:hypothetical protein